MSHHLLPVNAMSTPPGCGEGHDRRAPCCYLEKLRQSLNYLERITSVSPPASSSCSVGFSHSSPSRVSDTLGYTSQSPDCLVVYEPHVPSAAAVARGNAHVQDARHRHQRAYVSSSSEGSSSPDVQLGDSFTTLEDSGVDLELDPYHAAMTVSADTESEPDGQKPEQMDKSTHTSLTEISGVCFCVVEPRIRNQRQNLRLKTSPRSYNSGDFIPIQHRDTYYVTTEHQADNDARKYERDMTTGGYDGRARLASEENEWFVDETPTSTPTPNDDQSVTQNDQSCQTDKSIFSKRKTDSSKPVLDGVSNVAHGNDVFDDVSYGRRLLAPSDTDTVSVTSLEVAQIMTKRSVGDCQPEVNNNEIVKMLEEDRVKLQHQRLESYQKVCTDIDRFNRQSTEYRNSGPQQVIGNFKNQHQTKGRSIQNFVTQSLEYFFTEKNYNPTTRGSRKQSTSSGLEQQHANTPSSVNATNHCSSSPPDSGGRRQGYVNDFYPTLYQLIAAFQLVKVTLTNRVGLHVSPVVMDRTIFMSDMDSSKSSPRSDSVSSNFSANSLGAFHAVTKATIPPSKCTLLVIRGLVGFDAKVTAGKVSVGDFLIEVNDACMLNKGPKDLADVTRSAEWLRLVVGRRRSSIASNSQPVR